QRRPGWGWPGLRGAVRLDSTSRLLLAADADLDGLDHDLVALALGGQHEARTALVADLEQLVLEPVGQGFLGCLALLALDGDKLGVLGDGEDLFHARVALLFDDEDGDLVAVDLDQLASDLGADQAAGA